MSKKDNTERDDLAHLITVCISEEGYDLSPLVEREILSLANTIINSRSSEEEEDYLDNDDEYGNILFDKYDDEEELFTNTDDEDIE